MSFQQKEKDILQIVRKSIQNRNQSQLFYKAFLKPIQISLKTNTNSPKSSNAREGLPFGIKLAVKQSIQDNKFAEVDFLSFDQAKDKIKKRLSQIQTQQANVKVSSLEKGKYQLSDIKEENCDNMISLFKSGDKKISVAICICMYSQDKGQLKKTLAGVQQNIIQFHRNGIPSDEIGVFVVMDGIEPADSSIESYFDQLEQQSNIFLGGDVNKTDPRDLIEEDIQQEEQVINLNHLIFDDEELQDRIKRRFCNRKKQYKQIKDLLKKVGEMEKNKTLTFDNLDQRTQQFFIQKGRHYWKTQFALSDQDIKELPDEKILQKYAQNNKTARPIIAEALSQTKKYCNEYISTRNSLALLYSFRCSINILQLRENGPESRYEDNTQHQLQAEQTENSQSIIKMNLFFVTKYKNGGKLSSHNWFFNGFCEQLKPQYAILLDVGLAPEKDALWKMCYHMKQNPKVGGVCGYMGLRIQKLGDDEEVKDEQVDCITALCMKVVDIQRTQQFEYHFAHLIDKPFESSGCFKFIHVLPGAFSAYRIDALNHKYGHEGSHDGKQSELLKEYFKSINPSAQSQYKKSDYGIGKAIAKVALPDFIYTCFFGEPDKNSYQQLLYNQNIYLAEDRTLCMGIYQNQYELAYIPDAYAWVDPIKTLYGLLGQRKRWINGSYFAFEKVKDTLDKMQGNLCLKLQVKYLNFMNMMAFISPALFMYTVHIAMYTLQTNVIIQTLVKLNLVQNSAVASNRLVGLFVYIVDFIYVLIFLGLVFFSMHLNNRYSKFKSFFYGVSTLYGIFSISVFGVLLYDIISGFSGSSTFLIQNQWLVKKIGSAQLINSLRYVMIGIMGMYAFPVLISFIFCRFDHVIDILFSVLSFLFYSPTYLNILNIYALCRMDDISWGTKGLNTQDSGKDKQKTEEWKKIKLLHVSKFVLYNLIAGFLLLAFGDDYVLRFWFTFGIMILLGATLILKVIIGSLYMIGYKCCSSSSERRTGEMIGDHNLIENQFQRIKDSMYRELQNNLKGKLRNNKEDNKIDKSIDAQQLTRMLLAPKFKKQGRNSKKGNNLVSDIFKNSFKAQLGAAQKGKNPDVLPPKPGNNERQKGRRKIKEEKKNKHQQTAMKVLQKKVEQSEDGGKLNITIQVQAQINSIKGETPKKSGHQRRSLIDDTPPKDVVQSNHGSGNNRKKNFKKEKGNRAL